MTRQGLKVETCVYPYVRGDDARVMLLGRQRSGPNAGLWVPLGRPVDETSYPRTVAARDLDERALSVDRLRLCGLVTEVGDRGWQTHLLLFAAEVDAKLELQPDSFADKYVWVSATQASSLHRPQSDALFDYGFLMDGASYYAEVHFDRDERATCLASELSHR